MYGKVHSQCECSIASLSGLPYPFSQRSPTDNYFSALARAIGRVAKNERGGGIGGLRMPNTRRTSWLTLRNWQSVETHTEGLVSRQRSQFIPALEREGKNDY